MENCEQDTLDQLAGELRIEAEFEVKIHEPEDKLKEAKKIIKAKQRAAKKRKLSEAEQRLMNRLQRAIRSARLGGQLIVHSRTDEGLWGRLPSYDVHLKAKILGMDWFDRVTQINAEQVDNAKTELESRLRYFAQNMMISKRIRLGIEQKEIRIDA